MKKISLSLIADTLFYASCIWVVLLSVMRFYRIALWVSLFCATVGAIITGTISFFFSAFLKNKKFLSKKEQEECSALLFHLALEKPERVRLALVNAFQADGKSVHCEKENLSVDGACVIPVFTLEPLSADSIARIIQRYGSKFILLCRSLSAEAEKILSTFSIEVKREKEVYELFSKTNTIPAPLICGEIPRKTVRNKLRRTFSKTNSRPFFVSGVLLLLMSLFTFFPLYYLISGCILLSCALLIRFFGVKT